MSKVSIGNEILFELHKQKFIKVANLIAAKLEKRSNELKKQLVDDLVFSNENDFTEIKNQIIYTSILSEKLKNSSKSLFEIDFDELFKMLNLKYTMQEKGLKEEIITLLRDDREYFIGEFTTSKSFDSLGRPVID